MIKRDIDTDQPTSAEYAMGYAEGFNDACKESTRYDTIQQFIDSMSDKAEDKMFMQIEHWADVSYRHSRSQVGGTTPGRADEYDSHLIWATLQWAKKNGR